MYDNGINVENGSENELQEDITASEETSSISDGEDSLSDPAVSSEDSESTGTDFSEDMDESITGEGTGVEYSDGSSLGEDLLDEESTSTVDMVAVVEQLEHQNILIEDQNALLDSQAALLSMIIFILMFNICDRFISRIWSFIRSMGGSK
ncbi:MAG: hypothetical protein J6A73_04735 [Lachnospiraceae bacterium]|nr:hypothetical protein [Lachnospiraceae bacterium]